MNEAVIAALRTGATLVTASQRLARHLAAAYGAAQQALGAQVWEAPDILPWNQWLERAWQDSFGLLEADTPRLLLNDFQELTLWEEAIRAADNEEPLLQVPAAARSAREGWQLLHAWKLSIPRSRETASEDVGAFARWAKAYGQRCTDGNWLDSARLPDAVGNAITAGRLAPPHALILAGFDEITPQQDELLTAVCAAGVTVMPLAPATQPTRTARVGYDDRRAEIHAAAAWARAALESGQTRIGVVVPDLAAQRAAVVRLFDEALLPAALLAGADVVRPYNVSLGEPLAAWPVIHAALLVLEFGAGSLPVARLGTLLRSPFLAGASSEASARAQFDALLRQAGEETVTISTLLRSMAASLAMPQVAAPRLGAQLRAWRDHIPARSKQFAPSAWSEQFAALLNLSGWPGDGPLDSVSHQAVMAWRELLAAFAAQDVVSERLTYAEALAILRRMAGERVFQPQSPAAPVQVLGLLEASGLDFDSLWVMGLDDESWPPSPRPNPFLPLDLQRTRGLPHASAERELEFARRLTERLAASAANVVFSHPRNAGDETRRASPLLHAFPELLPGDLPAPQPGIASHLFAARTIETLGDELAPALAPGSAVKGGTRLFQYQAACPFRAFASLRLDARAPEEPEPGLDAKARGMLLHAALEALWGTLGSHAALCGRTEESLTNAIGEAVNAALDELARDRSQTLTGRFREIEWQRLTRLLRAWLDEERARAPFRVVAAEQKTTIKLGGLVVEGRMDRVDELDDGTRVILDYKTGETNIKSWQGERPDEPQLPLYAIDMRRRRPVAAALFAQLRAGELGFNGLAVRAGIVPKVKAAGETEGAWQAQLDAWQGTLTALAEAYRTGDARVDPKEFPRTCEHCGLQALCRVYERHPEIVEAENGNADDD
ncbi:MAG: PD-(D/E)XK nuclease family protein [Gammaproteobacteria bacterium]|nr:PD-(D/E)XK nuclease family protein [Gammaproteobacteria bacterium]